MCKKNFSVVIVNRKPIFLISPVLKTEPITSELIDITVFNNLALGPV